MNTFARLQNSTKTPLSISDYTSDAAAFAAGKVKDGTMAMELTTATSPDFVERRSSTQSVAGGSERRQFRDGNRSSRPEVAEFADAVDEYKVNHRRRFITFDELFDVMISLGYHK